MVCGVSNPTRQISGITWGMREKTHRLLTIFRTVRGFKRWRTSSSTSPQGRFLRRHDPTVLRSTEIAQRVLGYLSFPLQVLFGHLSLTRVQSLPEVGQPFERFRTVLWEFVVLGSSKTQGFYPPCDHQRHRADKSQSDRRVCAISRVFEVGDVQGLGTVFLS